MLFSFLLKNPVVQITRSGNRQSIRHSCPITATYRLRNNIRIFQPTRICECFSRLHFALLYCMIVSKQYYINLIVTCALIQNHKIKYSILCSTQYIVLIVLNNNFSI